MIRILVIDDEKDMLDGVRKLLNYSGLKCMTANNGGQGIKLMTDFQFDLILCDLFMPVLDGNQIIEKSKQIQPGVPVIIFTAFGTVERAVEAMKNGAYDFIEKPFDSEHLIMKIKRAVEFKNLTQEKENLISQLKDKFSFQNIIGKSREMLNVFNLIEQVAPVDANVLITGESGTGKELIARAIHALSKRSSKPFVPINCGSLPENLFEAELFGYERGAFTGAYNRKIGYLEFASGGTFFMDEVMEMPAYIQVKMLRVLQERKLTRVGGTHPVEFDVRIISATNRDVQKAIESGGIREDFYFRLNVVQIHLPPLRERKSDIPLLAYHFLEDADRSIKKKINEIDDEVLKLFDNYPWPGNVRELENAVKSSIILCSNNKIMLTDLPKYLINYSADTGFEKHTLTEAKQRATEKVEHDYLLYLLKKYSGNITKVAEESGMTRRNIHRIIIKHSLNPDDWRL